jgi:hypothetical protein
VELVDVAVDLDQKTITWKPIAEIPLGTGR